MDLAVGTDWPGPGEGAHPHAAALGSGAGRPRCPLPDAQAGTGLQQDPGPMGHGKPAILWHLQTVHQGGRFIALLICWVDTLH